MSSNIQSLENKIIAANNAYSKGEPYLSDEEYHELWRELRDLDPSNKNLYHTSANPNAPGQVMHKLKVLSLQKAFDSHDLKVFFQRFRDDSFVLQPKLDGVAIMLYAEPGDSIFSKAVLAGDGISGQDVSWMLPYIPGVPGVNQPFLSVEALIPWKNWDSSFGKNPRNTVAGIFNPSRNLPSELLSQVKLIPHDNPYFTEDLPAFSSFDSPEELSDYLLERFYYYYQILPIDGLVLKLNNTQKRLAIGHNNTFPLWSIAWKPPIQTEETKITDIIYQVSRAGRVIPKIQYNPIELCGTTNQFATANNMKWVLDNNIAIGNNIIIGKAGEIIPKILEVKNQGNHPATLTHCPICGTTLVWDSYVTHLICQGSECISQQIKSLDYFYGPNGVNLKTIGPKTIEDVLSNESLRKIFYRSPWALLDPWNFGIESKLLSILGEAKYKNYLDSLNEVSIDIITFIASLGYPALGYKTAKSLVESFQKDESPDRKIPDEAVKSFENAITDLKQATEELKNFKFQPLPGATIARYCITGNLPFSRGEIIHELSNLGLEFVSGVSRNLDFLIVGESGIGTSKHKKAKKLDIPLMEYEEVINQYGEE